MKIKAVHINLACGVGFLLFALYCAAFTVTHKNIILNRYTDSWWHIAAAEEYAASGEFAKDPFFVDAPPFAQFGLMEFVNARLSLFTGASTRDIWPWLVGWNVLAAAMVSFLTGFLIRRKFSEALACGFGWMIVYGRHTIIGVGMPFAAALPLLFLMLVLLWNGTRIAGERLWMSVLKGALLALIFNLHVFVGLIGCLIVAVAFICELMERHRSRGALIHLVIRAALMGAVFMALASRWILMHVRLRPFLAQVNAHNNTAYGVENRL